MDAIKPRDQTAITRKCFLIHFFFFLEKATKSDFCRASKLCLRKLVHYVCICLLPLLALRKKANLFSSFLSMAKLPPTEALSLTMLRTTARHKASPSSFIAVFSNTNRKKKMKLGFFFIFNRFNLSLKGGETTDKNLEMKVDVNVTRKAISLVGQKKKKKYWERKWINVCLFCLVKFFFFFLRRDFRP